MKPLFIAGIGIVCARGRGLDQFEKALQEGWVAPTPSKEGRLAYRIADADLMDRHALKDVRRADRFGRLTVLAAHDALSDNGVGPETVRPATGIIVATAFGSHATTFKFLDGVIDYGEGNVSPTTFAHSIHNSAASYIAGAIGCQGPTVTVTSFSFSFQQALLLAYVWLQEGRVQQVLVGVSEECSTPMEYICAQKLSMAADGKMNPLSCLDQPKVVLGEGSVFFLVTLDEGQKKYGAFSEIRIGKEVQGWADVDLSILSAHGMGGSEKIYESVVKKEAPAAAYSGIYGGMLTSGAFECAAAALMLKHQVRYASPVFQAGSPFKVDEKAVRAPLQAIQCVAHHCDGKRAFIKMVSSC